MCRTCFLPHRINVTKISPTAAARLQTNALAHVADLRGHHGFAQWLRRLNKKVDLRPAGDYDPYNRVFSAAKILSGEYDVYNLEDCRNILLFSRRWPRLLADRWVAEVCDDVVSAAPVDWPKHPEEVDDEEVYWQTLVDAVHGVAERNWSLVSSGQYTLSPGLEPEDVNIARKALQMGLPEY